MSVEVVLQGTCHILPLGDNAYTLGYRLLQSVHQERIVCATENDGIDERVLLHQLVDTLAHEELRALALCLASLHDGSPEGARLTSDGDVGEEVGYLYLVALRAYGTLRCHDADVARVCELADDLHRRAYDTEYAVVRAVHLIIYGEVILLYAAECLCTGSVTAENDEVATHIEEPEYRLARKLVDHVEGPRSVGGTCVVAQIDEVPLRQVPLQLLENGQTTVAGVEDSYGRESCCHFFSAARMSVVTSSERAGSMYGQALLSVLRSMR